MLRFRVKLQKRWQTNCKQHVMEMMQSEDESHKAAVESMMQLSKEEQGKWYEDFKKGFDSLQNA